MRETDDSQRFLACCGDAAVAEIALRQHGVVSVAQLRAAGLGEGAILWRVRRRRLHRVHRGVYAVGHARLGERGRMWAATVAFPHAVLSHRSAAAAWDLCSLPGRLDVTTPPGNRSTARLRVHHVGVLDATSLQDGLPVTTVAQTLRDLAAVESTPRLTRLLARADQLRLLDVAAVELPPRTRGSRRMRSALDELALRQGGATRSELEERFLELVARAGLPRPAVNEVVGGHERDFVWRRQRVVAETDGAATHRTAAAFEDDRRRDAALTAAGWRVVRFTWRQVTREPDAVAAVVRRLLA
jgi:very-short-patch-repair endonuclease